MVADDATDRPGELLSRAVDVWQRGITGSVPRAVARRQAFWTDVNGAPASLPRGLNLSTVLTGGARATVKRMIENASRREVF